uniref:Uncharacterized protein n=1 Tax=Anopheles arabiensis TaxID=7173 RepID=A0A182IGP8_ANOAR
MFYRFCGLILCVAKNTAPVRSILALSEIIKCQTQQTETKAIVVAKKEGTNRIALKVAFGKKKTAAGPDRRTNELSNACKRL